MVCGQSFMTNRLVVVEIWHIAKIADVATKQEKT
jgi:hypothetical protein